MTRWLVVSFALLASGASAEYVPPPTIADLMKAECAAVGRFVVRDGTARFVLTRVLWGDPAPMFGLAALRDGPVRVHENGRVTVWTWGPDGWSGGLTAGEGTWPGVWFHHGEESVTVQPLEFERDFRSLRAGREPRELFRLLQRLDFDMRRAAVERLFADRDEGVVNALHRIALDAGSHAASDAVDVLMQTRLLDDERFWAVWPEHADAYRLHKYLKTKDAARVERELRMAVDAEERPAELDQLLWLAVDDVELWLRYLDHPVPDVRARALSNLHSHLYQCAHDPERKAEGTALAKRVRPWLTTIRKHEKAPDVRRRLDELLAEEHGVPWILRVEPAPEPPFRYDEPAEREFMIDLLTSSGRSGFPLESAGREIAKHFADEGIGRLRERIDSSSHSARMVWEGLGYVRHPKVFALLTKFERAETPAAAIRAIGRQRNAGSEKALRQLVRSHVARRELCDALGLLRTPAALAMLRAHADTLGKRKDIAYLGALAALGDAPATARLVAKLREGDPSEELVGALLAVDAPAATEALKEHLARTWPGRWESFDQPMREFHGIDMENYAGAFRRSTLAGEVARRDPQWLAGLALRKMDSPRLLARAYGAYVFRGLTGRSGAYRPWAFASERAAPYEALRRWWAEHDTDSREQWILSYFAERGYRMDRLHAEASVPVLARALDGDELTRGLAIEQISVVTGKYFGPYAQPRFEFEEGGTMSWGGPYEMMDKEKTAIRVRGWLRARGWLPE